ncbi:putative NADH-flavin reductase [Bacillus chungangensis]|uniref:NADH-flavin reductase n=1 Tax=Bacillus chungangensis TaxID=587633 RepID=A0ABT9WP11_9BACI|nr:putative NADH-flavin reductase [Bacillus chungangensis]
MQQTRKITIIGGTGKVGKYIKKERLKLCDRMKKQLTF